MGRACVMAGQVARECSAAYSCDHSLGEMVMDHVVDAFDGTTLKATRKTGHEKFHVGTLECEFDLLDFWRWSVSDLVSNTWRGVVAEYIVARSLGVAEGVRNDWAPFDLETHDGVKVEVKSAAHVQSWKQEKHSTIQFGVGKGRAWDAETNRLGEEVRRHADVYVFALLHHKDRQSIDPMDLAQWEFYVVPTKALNERERSQHSITLPSLLKLAKAVAFEDLREAVARPGSVAAGMQRTADPPRFLLERLSRRSRLSNSSSLSGNSPAEIIGLPR